MTSTVKIALAAGAALLLLSRRGTSLPPGAVPSGTGYVIPGAASRTGPTIGSALAIAGIQAGASAFTSFLTPRTTNLIGNQTDPAVSDWFASQNAPMPSAPDPLSLNYGAPDMSMLDSLMSFDPVMPTFGGDYGDYGFDTSWGG